MVVLKDNYKTTATPTFVYTYVVDIDTNKVIATNCFSYERCYNSWTQSGIKPTHKKFPGEMMIKTSESYLATRLYNKSNSDNDNQLQDEYESNTENDNAIVVDDFETSTQSEPKKVVQKETKHFEPTPTVEEEPVYEEQPFVAEEVEIEDIPAFDFGRYQEQPNEINTFLDEDTFDFETTEPEQEPQTNKLHVKYRDYMEKYKAQGYTIVKDSWNAADKTCDIELKK